MPGGQIHAPLFRAAALFALTQEMVRSHRQPCPRIVGAFHAAGYEERHLLYMVLAIAVKTLSYYTKHAFATQVDERFAAYKVG